MLDPSQKSRASARGLSLRAQAGDTMIEVVIATLIVALIAAAAFAAFGAASDISGAQRHQEQAASLAEQDEFRLRGLSSAELIAIAPSGSSNWAAYGNETHTTTVGHVTYTVTSVSKFVSASGGGSSCSTSGTSSADYIETSSQVSWGSNNDNRQPVIEHSLISPNEGGAMIFQDVDSYANPLAGVSITIEGPSPSTATETLSTDGSGCAVFSGLNGGLYNITESDPGWVTLNGVTTQSQQVVVGQTVTGTEFTWGQLASVAASFQTFVNGSLVSPISWDTFSLTDTAGTLGTEPGPFGTVGTTPRP